MSQTSKETGLNPLSESTSKKYELFIPFLPVPKARARFSKWGTYTPAKTRNAEQCYKEYVVAVGREIIYGPLQVYLAFYLPKPKSKKKAVYPDCRPDLDNYAKLVCDAMNGVLWKDDGQICSMRLEKRYVTDDNVGIYVYVTSLS